MLALASGPYEGQQVSVVGFGRISPIISEWSASGRIEKMWQARDGTSLFTAAYDGRPLQCGSVHFDELEVSTPRIRGRPPSAGAASKNRTSAIPTIRAEHERQCVGRAFVMPVPTDRMSIIRASFAPRGLGGVPGERIRHFSDGE